MNPREYADCDGLELAARIRRGELTASEAVAHAYRVIEAIDPQVNAFVSLERDDASEAVRAPVAGPFSGVPIAMKDCADFVRGAPRRFGSRLTAVFRSEHDDEVVARYKASGLIPIGTTNVPEFSSSLTTESQLHGPCRNPWSLGRSVGGSSGGSAAAVAYGAVPIAYGNDSAGSIRVPASCCGVFGFRPSRGRVPMGPTYGEIWHGLFSHHVLSRSVRDSATVLDISAGIDAGAPYGAPTPARPYSEECFLPPSRLRIAFMDGAAQGFELAPECARALSETVDLLRRHGHDVRPASPGYDGAEMIQCLTTLLAVALAEEIPLLARDSGARAGPSTVEACHLALMERGIRTSALDLSRALQYRHAMARTLGRFLQAFDVLLSPTLAQLPPPLGALDANGPDADDYLQRMWRFSPFTPLANLCGAPSMSVPLCWTGAGLPVGVMFTGRYADEATLFRLAGELERIRPWRDRHPPLGAWSLDHE
jgi:amidase